MMTAAYLYNESWKQPKFLLLGLTSAGNWNEPKVRWEHWTHQHLSKSRKYSGSLIFLMWRNPGLPASCHLPSNLWWVPEVSPPRPTSTTNEMYQIFGRTLKFQQCLATIHQQWVDISSDKNIANTHNSVSDRQATHRRHLDTRHLQPVSSIHSLKHSTQNVIFLQKRFPNNHLKDKVIYLLFI